MKEEVYKQIKSITRLLNNKSIQVSQNFPKFFGSKNEEIAWEQYQNLSFSLKDEPYDIIYKETNLSKDYNFKFFDQAIVQMKYTFHRQNIVSHVLSYYPNPNIESFKDAIEDYEERHYGDTLFGNIIDGKFITFPLRFDFVEEDWTDCEHPKSHASFGNYRNCRIPVSKPISPNKFILFLLRSFYFERLKEAFREDINSDFQKRCHKIDNNKKLNPKEKEKLYLQAENDLINKIFHCPLRIPESISELEKGLIHFNFY